MTLLVALTAALAAANWISRAFRHRRTEVVTKPAVTTALIVLTLVLEPVDGSQRALFTAALAFCLVGDVALMLERERFVEGLAAFLVGHVLFSIGLLVRGDSVEVWSAAVAVVAIVACLPIFAVRTLAKLRASRSRLTVPVVAYVAVITAMCAASLVGGSAAAPLGAASFAVSDSILADNRFVSASSSKSVAVMVTYHAALALLVLSLV